MLVGMVAFPLASVMFIWKLAADMADKWMFDIGED